MGEIRNEHNIWKILPKRLGVNERIIMKWILKNLGLRMRTGFFRLRIGPRAGLRRTVPKKDGIITEKLGSMVLVAIDEMTNSRYLNWALQETICWRALRAHVTRRARLASVYVPVRTALAKQVNEHEPDKMQWLGVGWRLCKLSRCKRK